MRRLCVLALVASMVVGPTGSAWAQRAQPDPTTASDARPLPFFKEPVGSIREAARACENEDRSVMNVSCDQMRETVNRTFKKLDVDLQFATKEEWVEYMGMLSQKPLGHPREGSKVPFARLMPTGSVDIDGFRREVRDGELGAYDNQNGVFVFSLSCGNPIGGLLNVFTAMGQNDLDRRRSLRDQADDEARKAAADNRKSERDDDHDSGKFLGMTPKQLGITAGTAAALAGLVIALGGFRNTATACAYAGSGPSPCTAK